MPFFLKGFGHWQLRQILADWDVVVLVFTRKGESQRVYYRPVLISAASCNWTWGCCVEVANARRLVNLWDSENRGERVGVFSGFSASGELSGVCGVGLK